MRLEHLQYLLEIDAQHSISAAARKLYLGQTSLNAIVNSVEKELGFKIFDRSYNGVRSTPEGEEALALIWEINASLDKINAIKNQNSVMFSVPIIISPIIHSALALPLNKLFEGKEPNGNLQFHVIIGDEIGARIIKGEANIGLTYFPMESAENFRMIASKYRIHVEKVLSDYFYLMMRKDHPLAQRTRVNIEEIKYCDFAMLAHFNSAESFAAYLRNSGEGNRYTTFPNMTLIKKAVLEQNMIAITSGYAAIYACDAMDEPLRIVRLSGEWNEVGLSMYLIHRHESDIYSQEKIAINCIKKYFEDINVSMMAKSLK